MEAENGSATPKTVIVTTKYHSPDTQLAQGRRTHQAWFARHIQIRVRKCLSTMQTENIVGTYDLRVASCVKLFICEVRRATDGFASPHVDAAHRDLSRRQRLFCLPQR
eukprot:CAMPEP_0118967158 /NCGR_PEP_ID=MMETSP1173-20130426/4584_1 /TAXON_ID=1034831 /ORGANISM="Rhizochromulina marina cf, Strain CCMP1243" /LENGTH=107 /DNA_ID=CAMNT_0006916071 /DNA_START=319 /DNA_END=638 /DNA_ORIENTATION=+